MTNVTIPFEVILDNYKKIYQKRIEELEDQVVMLESYIQFTESQKKENDKAETKNK